MDKLLRFEFYKLLHQKSMWVCSGILFCLLFLSLLTVKFTWGNAAADALGAAPTAFSIAASALSSCSFSLILAIFTALFVSGDSSEGTLKNIYAKGYKRTEVFLSKLIVVSVYCIVMAVICFAVALVGGRILFADDSALKRSELVSLIAQLFIMLAYTFLYAVIASIAKKSGDAIAGCIVAPMLVGLVIGMADTLLRLDRFKFSAYWLDAMYSAVSADSVTKNSLSTAIIGSLLYMAAFLLAGIYSSNKKQV